MCIIGMEKMQPDDAEGEGWSATLRAATFIKGITCRGELCHHVAIQTKLALNSLVACAR
jgi:hypothetical protein